MRSSAPAPAGQVTVRVPATSANLGPGFDCLGMAVTCWNEFTFSPGAPDPEDADHLALRAYRQTCEILGLEPHPLSVTGGGVVPRTRGLGSSSTCIVAGVLAAGSLHGVETSAPDVIRLATAVEGHPDNVAPAVLGGVVASAVTEDGEVLTARVPLALDLELTALVPDARLSTAEAREALPAFVSHADAVFTSGRAALLVAALASGERRALRDAFDDRLHETYRAPLIPRFDEIVAATKAAGAWGVYLSGAGPTIMTVGPVDAEAIQAELTDHPWAWELRPMQVCHQGAEVL